MELLRKPLAIDLYAGLGGWTEGLLAEGWDVTGFDIEAHVYGDERYPGKLVVQDVLTLHGSQFKDVDLIVASPPCQAYSYMAMPWSLAKAKAAAIRADHTGVALADLNALFNACFRIQREACEAAGRHIPMVVENVRGAQPWVGRAAFNYGSFYLWGDVPALMPTAKIRGQSDAVKHTGRTFCFPAGSANPEAVKGRTGKLHWGGPDALMTPAAQDGRKVPSFRFDGSGASFQTASVRRTEGIKVGGDWFSDPTSLSRTSGSKSSARKRASAQIAKIPLPLSQHIARVYRPRVMEVA